MINFNINKIMISLIDYLSHPLSMIGSEIIINILVLKIMRIKLFLVIFSITLLQKQIRLFSFFFGDILVVG